LWWFEDYLDTVLEYANWELLRWIRSKPEAKIFVEFSRAQAITNTFKLWHPGNRKVDVFQHHPSALRASSCHHHDIKTMAQRFSTCSLLRSKLSCSFQTAYTAAQLGCNWWQGSGR
jgi:hypothetical protein